MPSIEQLERLLSLDESDTFVLYALAQEHAKGSHHEKAVEYYDRCIAIDEAYCYAYFHKARSLEAMERVDAALETLQTGLAAAKRVNDRKAIGEIGGYLTDLRLLA